MHLSFRRQKLKPTFVPLQGYEKGFFERNMKKYFGNDVEWQEGVDWDSGLEGFVVTSRLQEQPKQALVKGMRAAATKEFNDRVEALRAERGMSPPAPAPTSGRPLESRPPRPDHHRHHHHHRQHHHLQPPHSAPLPRQHFHWTPPPRPTASPSPYPASPYYSSPSSTRPPYPASPYYSSSSSLLVPPPRFATPAACTACSRGSSTVATGNASIVRGPAPAAPHQHGGHYDQSRRWSMLEPAAVSETHRFVLQGGDSIDDSHAAAAAAASAGYYHDSNHISRSHTHPGSGPWLD